MRDMDEDNEDCGGRPYKKRRSNEDVDMEHADSHGLSKTWYNPNPPVRKAPDLVTRNISLSARLNQRSSKPVRCSAGSAQEGGAGSMSRPNPSLSRSMKRSVNTYNTSHRQKHNSGPIVGSKVVQTFGRPSSVSERLNKRSRPPVPVGSCSTSANERLSRTCSSRQMATSQSQSFGENPSGNRRLFQSQVNKLTQDGIQQQSHFQNFEEHAGDEEVMDWEDISSEELEAIIAARRNEVSTSPEIMDIYNSKINQRSNCPRKIMVVVDTNVFIAQLSLVKYIMSDRVSKDFAAIYIPWRVMCELDGLKHRNEDSLSSSARLANDFIFRALEDNSSMLCGQAAHEEKLGSKFFNATTPDDRILQACLLLQDKHHVLLWTGDKNLGSKAMLSKIRACSSKNIRETLREMVEAARSNFHCNGGL